MDSVHSFGISLSNKELIKQIELWFRKRNPKHVKMLRNDQPSQDPDDDYQVVFEIVFEPHDSRRARIELWLTESGNIGLGIEQRRRVARALDLQSTSPRFAGGFEPMKVPYQAIEKFLDLVADGRLAMRYVVVPLFGILYSMPSLQLAEIENLKEIGFPVSDCLMTAESPHVLTKTLRYEPW